MNANVRRKMSMVKTVLDFAASNPLGDPGFTLVVTRLQAANDRFENLANDQVGGRSMASNGVARRAELRVTIRSESLDQIMAVHDFLTQSQVDVPGQFVMPPADCPNKVFILGARALLVAATAQKDLLIGGGLAANVLDDLAQSLTDIEAATTNVHAGRAVHIRASEGLRVCANAAVKDARLLGTYFLKAYHDAPDQLRAWRSAVRIAGPFTRSAPEPAPAPPAASPPAATIPPAAPAPVTTPSTTTAKDRTVA